MAKQLNKILLLGCLLTVSCLRSTGNEVPFVQGVSMSSVMPSPLQLKILSWNIRMLPFVDLFREKDDRAEAIAKVLCSKDYDIIVFQEAFTARARTVIYHSLQEKYPYAYGPVNGSGVSLKFNSGIWILSKIRLVLKKEITFKQSDGFDWFARKGAVLFEGSLHNTIFQLIATHLQDEDYPQIIREKQLTEIYEKLIIPFSVAEKPQIICGDFNTDEECAEKYYGMLNLLNAEDGVLTGTAKFSFGDRLNDAFPSARKNPRLIDYVLTRNSKFIRWVQRKVAVLKSTWGEGKEYLSDHHGIEAVIEFRSPNYLSRLIKTE
jgi:endonuclease/exonuclease/phosphatase family metal-dependent hydrolase